MAGLVPAIHVLLAGRKTWMPAPSAGMTLNRCRAPTIALPADRKQPGRARRARRLCAAAMTAGPGLIAFAPWNGHKCKNRSALYRREKQRTIRVQGEGIPAMAEQFVGKASEIKDGDRRIVFVGEHEIGVFK